MVNPASSPVPVAATDNPARQAVQQDSPLTFGSIQPNGTAEGTATLTVPAGKILVIETVGYTFLGFTNLNNVEVTVISGSVTMPSTPTSVNYFLNLVPANSRGFFSSTQAVKLYAQPSSTVTLRAEVAVAPGAVTGTDMAISGYLVNAP